MKKKYAFAGASIRGLVMFMKPMISEELSDFCELVGVYDVNKGRGEHIAKETGQPFYDNFETMINETKPDTVIVTTVDAYHSDYIIKSLEMGCDVITEKPMTTDANKCNAILEAEKRTGKKVTVTFNYRFVPLMTKVKEIVSSATIGDVFSVHFEWMLPRNMLVGSHGTSYFRRWNSIMEKSGGLLVHKSTHHFDLINWWIAQEPKYVSAFGKLNLYGEQGSKKYAGGICGENCRRCEHTSTCEFYHKIEGGEITYFSNYENFDNYFKDRCVYSKEINIYDTMAVNVQYKEGALLTYSLNATTPYEGWRMTINGSGGRLELFVPESGVLNQDRNCDTVEVYDLKNNITKHEITRVKGGHGGGDVRLRRMIFVGDLDDPMGHTAGTKDGANSIIIGAAANISIKEKRMIDIDEIIDRYWN